jgi:hypothetical protein
MRRVSSSRQATEASPLTSGGFEACPPVGRGEHAEGKGVTMYRAIRVFALVLLIAGCGPSIWNASDLAV